MKRRTLQWNVAGDDGGQALTEFVIVIPIVLLFFFVMVQYFSIVQASQLGDYAAFVAARVYAVSGHDANPQDEAQTAAALVLAPIARPVLGEIGGNTAIGSLADSVESTFSSIAGSSTLGMDIYDFASGYAMAKYVRLNPNILGGSVTITNEGTPSQVNVTINYPQPIFMPGLAGLWNFVNGSNIYASMARLAQGLQGIAGTLLPLYGGSGPLQNFQQELSQFDPGASSSLSSLISSLPVVLLPYVNIQSKCSIGYSGWSGVPRLPNKVTDISGSDTNLSNTAQNVQNYQKANENYTNAVKAAKADCQAVTNACGKIAADNAVINQISAIPQNQRTQAQTDQLNAANSDKSTQEGNLSTAEGNLASDQANVKTYADQVNQYQSQLGSAVQSQTANPSAQSSFQPMATSIDCPACNN
jgi:Flp pilus assembly protein TadG